MLVAWRGVTFALLTIVGCLAGGACSLVADLDGLRDGPEDGGSGSGASGSGAGPGSGATSSGPSTGGHGGGSSSSASTSSTAPGSGGNTGFDPPWFDPAWGARARVTVKNDATVELPVDFETGFRMDVNSRFPGATPESLRVARWDETASSWSWMPTYVETIEGEVWLWTALQDVLAASGGTLDHYWVYAANPSPPAADDPASVFKIEWQPFDDLIGWAIGDTPAVSGGNLVLEVNDTAYTSQKYGPGYAIDFEMTIESLPPCALGCWLSGGFHDKYNAEPWMLWINRDGKALVVPEVEIAERSVSFKGSNFPVTVGASAVYGVERFANHVVFRYQNELAMNGSSWIDDWLVALPARLAAVGGGKATFDWARVRRAADPAPQVTLANAEFY